MWFAVASSGEPAQRANKPDVCDRVADLRPAGRLKVWQQVELAAVIGAMVWATERDDALGVVAATQRARLKVCRIDGTHAGHQTAKAGHVARGAAEAS
jgi:hypothetical protein